MRLLVSCIPFDGGKSGLSVYAREVVRAPAPRLKGTQRLGRTRRPPFLFAPWVGCRPRRNRRPGLGGACELPKPRSVSGGIPLIGVSFPGAIQTPMNPMAPLTLRLFCKLAKLRTGGSQPTATKSGLNPATQCLARKSRLPRQGGSGILRLAAPRRKSRAKTPPPKAGDWNPQRTEPCPRWKSAR